jgi:hypothetical protein
MAAVGVASIAPLLAAVLELKKYTLYDGQTIIIQAKKR